MSRHDDHSWIDSHLTSSLARLDIGPAPPDARYAKVPRRRWRRRAFALSGIPAILSTHVGAAAAALPLVAATGVAAKGAVTGDPNPLHWGATVTQAVQTCRADLTSGSHGIGQCVSDQAAQNGQAQSGDHPTPNGGNGQADGNGQGNALGVSHGGGNDNGSATPGEPASAPPAHGASKPSPRKP